MQVISPNPSPKHPIPSPLLPIPMSMQWPRKHAWLSTPIVIYTYSCIHLWTFCLRTCMHIHICMVLKISASDIISVDWNKLQSFTKMRPLQKQYQSPSVQCAGIRYPRSSEHPLIQSSLFTGGQVATLNGLFHGQTGHLPNIANTKASERQIFNWSTSAL